ncbi:PP0621 family protein [Giesbergeria anulus]|uniref:MYND finger n=1 Tax=Giesbergeria anulus TaxID=180197 RepID=A0A1H9L608_9BURK|nr:PP0621 family protein [Giesbergeria anulus]SER06748.1 uncharacterized protein SAMN02982919_01668 [Giesbergeria anulus]
MKYLVLLIVLVLGYGWWRSGRRAQMRTKAPDPVPNPAPQEIVTCAHCGLHLPRSEALAQGTRYYCSPEHQQSDVVS